MRSVRVKSNVASVTQLEFTECQWRSQEVVKADQFSKDLVNVFVDTCVKELKRRLYDMSTRWLLPATVYTEHALYRFVLENMIRPSLVTPFSSYEAHISDSVFQLVRAPSEHPTPFELVINSSEYSERLDLIGRLIPFVLQRVKDTLQTAVGAFLERTIDKALPAEAGLLHDYNNPYVLPLLYGSWVTSSKKSERVWRMATFDEDEEDTRCIEEGIVRLTLQFLHENREKVLFESNGAKDVGLGAAQLLAFKLSERFTDASLTLLSEPDDDIKGVIMRKDTGLCHLLSEIFSCHVGFITENVFKNPALVPRSLSVQGFLNVRFVIENMLFSQDVGTLTIPRALKVDYVTGRVKLWTSRLSCIRRGLALAFENPCGISAKKLREFAIHCGAPSRCFIHIFRALHVMMQGVMMNQAFNKREILTMERGMGDPHSIEERVLSNIQLPNGPWKSLIKEYKQNGDYIFSLADLMEECADKACNGTTMRLPYTGRSKGYLQATVPTFTGWDFKNVAVSADPNLPGVWRILDTFVNMESLGKHVDNFQTLFDSACNIPKELVDLAFGRTVPSFKQVMYGFCNGVNSRGISLITLPVMVILWNAAYTTRRRMRDRAEFVPISVIDEPVKKRRRTTSSCDYCMQDVESVVDIGCEHTICKVCASAVLEMRAVDNFCKSAHINVTCCPMDPKCSGRFDLNSARELLPSEIYALLNIRKKVNSSIPCCFACGSDAPDTHNIKVDGAVFTCKSCDCSTCSMCERRMHPGEPCVGKHNSSLSPEDLLSLAKIQNCPTCKTPEVKRKNCNHLKCKVCSTDWCWSCASVLDSKDVTVHYRDESPQCIMYNVQTETSRMKAFLESKRAEPGMDTIVQKALTLLSDYLKQTDDDL